MLRVAPLATSDGEVVATLITLRDQTEARRVERLRVDFIANASHELRTPVTAVHTIWLAARAQGIGLGWISILDPAAIAAILEVPTTWKLIGYFCLGYPEAEDRVPELEQAGWEERSAVSATVVRR